MAVHKTQQDMQSVETLNHPAEQKPIVNRNYKDTIFRMLFKDKKNLLSLYNAMNGKQYQDEGALQIVTLENAIYMEMKNDLAFIIDMNLHLYEHQSTKNPNMPLRNLFYISKEYQKLVEQTSLYSTSLQKIPTPRFVVFYNGVEDMEDKSELLLSSAYESQVENPDLELKVTVFNINNGHNNELLQNCSILKEYAQYVEKAREYTAKPEMALETAIEYAVNECIEKGILREFLLKNKSEAIEMSIFEYNKEEEIRKYKQAEREAARAEYLAKGLAKGRAEEAKKFIFRLLAKYGQLSERTNSLINMESDLEMLDEWFNLALEVSSVEEFEEKISIH